MNLPVISQLVALIEEIFKTHGTQVVQVAEQAAVGAAVTSVEADPKVQAVTQASVALLAAAQTLKSAIQTAPPVASAAISTPPAHPANG